MWPFKPKPKKLIPEIGDKVIYEYAFMNYEGIILSEGEESFCINVTKGEYVYFPGDNMLVRKSKDIIILEKAPRK